MSTAYRSIANRYSDLQSATTPQAFCTRALAILEWDFRAMALLALADWQQLDIVEPELFAAIGGLQRPSWGTWNFLLQSLRTARKAQLRSGRPDVRARIEKARTLKLVLARLDATASPEVLEAARPLAKLLGDKTRLKRLGDVLALPIALRNQVAHFPPMQDTEWLAMRAALEPLVELHASTSSQGFYPEHDWPAPWFFVENDEVWSFNGADKDLAPSYAAITGTRPKVEAERTASFVHALETLLGRTDHQATSFHRLLARLAPDDIRGVVLGDFLVGAPVGRGGFSTVHVARQLSTGRKVAIKLLHDGLGEDARARFQQEAEFLSRVTSPAVVGVISHGEDAWSVPKFVDLKDEPWFQELTRSSAIKTYMALEWIDGQTLEQIYESVHVAKSTPAPALDVLGRWFHEAAVALAAVHAAGLVHRDIKPGNLMIDSESRVRLMDFGIARSDDDNRTLMTTTGSRLGTPPYMSPEQIRAADAEAEVGPASDLYSLSATFYELITGHRLFGHDRESLETVKTKKLRGELPEAPRYFVKDLPWELETILIGGLQNQVADRYKSAAAMAADLKHWQRNESIEYRRPTLGRRALLAYRRHRVVTNIVAMAAVALMAVGTLYIRNVRAARNEAEHERDTAVARSDDLTLTQAEHALDSDPSKTLAWLKELSPRFSRWDDAREVAKEARLRGVARYVITAPHDFEPRDERAAMSPNGTLVAAAADKRVEVTRLKDMQRFDLEVGSPISAVRFASDNELFVVSPGKAMLWNATTSSSSPLKQLEGTPQGADAIEVSRSGRWIAVASPASGDRAEIWIWDLEQHTSRHYERPTPAWSLRFDSSETHLLATGQQKNAFLFGRTPIDRGVTIFDLAGGEPRYLCCHEKSETKDIAVNGADFLESGGVVTVTSDGELGIWDDDDRSGIYTLEQGSSLYSVRVIDSIAYIGSEKGLLRVDLRTMGRLPTVRTDTVLDVPPPIDQTIVLSSPLELADGRGGTRIPIGKTSSKGQSIAYPDRRVVLTIAEKELRVWDLDSLELRLRPAHDAALRSVAVSAAGDRVVSADARGEVRSWNGTDSKVLLEPDGTSRYVWLSRDGRVVLIKSENSLRRLEGETSQELFVGDETIEPDKSLPFAASPRGDTVMVARSTKTLSIWTQSRTRDLELEKPFTRLAVSADGRCGAIEGEFSIELVSLPDGGRRFHLDVEHDDIGTGWRASDAAGPVSSVIIAPDCSRIAYIHESQEVRVFDVASAKQLTAWKSPDGAMWSVLFVTADRVLAANQNGKLWSLTPGADTRPDELPRATDGISELRLLDGGKKVMGIGQSIAVWDLSRRTVREPVVTERGDSGDTITDAAASEDGELIAAALYKSPLLYRFDGRIPKGPALRAWLSEQTTLQIERHETAVSSR
jgi:serine/threonine protein kinase/WD40 repeat protein